jgi:hypothetical protein
LPIVAGVNTTDLLRDSYYIPIIAEIEQAIHRADTEAAVKGFVLTDSQVRSIVHKAGQHAGGESPKVATGSPRDVLLAQLYTEITGTFEKMRAETDTGEVVPLPLQDWVLGLLCVEDSIRLRVGPSGSRDYLDYLKGFFAQLTGVTKAETLVKRCGG